MSEVENNRRVVVTGVGIIVGNGHNADEFWSAAVAGKSGISRVEGLNTTGYGSSVGGEVKDFALDRIRHLAPAGGSDRAIDLALAAAQEAIERSGLSLPDVDHERFGVVLGTCLGGMRSGEEWQRQWIKDGWANTNKQLVLLYPFHAPVDALSRAFNLKGPKSTISTACAAGANAIGYAFDLIRQGKADIMLAGGTDPLAELGYGGFSSLQSLSPNPCAPYSGNREGLTLGEGAGVVVLERLDLALQRGAPILAEILGYGLSADGYHPTAPHPTGAGAARAIGFALEDAGITKEAVQYINGHGTGTEKNDAAETKAIKAAFGEHAYKIPVSSTKSMIGHTLGAAGAVEGIATILTIKNQTIHPTISYREADPACDLDYVPNVARRAQIDVALSNNFAFGGNNAAVIYGRYQDSRGSKRAQRKKHRVVITGFGLLSAAGVGLMPFWEALSRGECCLRPIAGFDASTYPTSLAGEVLAFDFKEFISPKAARRMDTISKYGVATTKMALADAGLEVTEENGPRVGIICGTGSGPVESIESFKRPIVLGGPAEANPAIFPNTVYNAAPGQIAMAVQAVGYTSTLTADRASSASAICYAFDLLQLGVANALICANMDELNEAVFAAHSRLGGLAAEPPRPFDSQRRGYVLAGGAATLIVETLDHALTRGARIYAEVVGYGMTSDACEIGSQDESGWQLARAMREAMAQGKVTSEEVQLICASANGSRLADLAEARAIQLAMGDAAQRTPVTSIKSTVGDPQGCTGSMGVAAAVLAMQEGLVPPILNFASAEEGCILNIVAGQALAAKVDCALVNSVGCGGNNVSILLRRY